ncbi:MAG: hypothetical protein NC217_00335 [Muribaculaceae bacterium]|nr:hypothetical protein [Muribaculaceae bacterium]
MPQRFIEVDGKLRCAYCEHDLD